MSGLAGKATQPTQAAAGTATQSTRPTAGMAAQSTQPDITSSTFVHPAGPIEVDVRLLFSLSIYRLVYFSFPSPSHSFIHPSIHSIHSFFCLSSPSIFDLLNFMMCVKKEGVGEEEE